MDEKIIAYWKSLLSIFASLGLCFLYLLLKGGANVDSIRSLLVAILPGAIMALLAIPIVYYVFKRQLDNQLNYINPTIYQAGCTNTKINDNQIYSNYRQLDWNLILENSKLIEMVVCYMDSWANDHWDKLLEFYRRGGQIKLVMTNTEIDFAIKSILCRFKKLKNTDELKDRIKKTVSLFKEALKCSGSTTGSLEVCFIDEPVNYASIKVDNKDIYFSLYEHMETNKRVKSPTIHYNLDCLESIKAFWNNEYQAIYSKSKREIFYGKDLNK